MATALARLRLGNSGSTNRSTLSTTVKKTNHEVFWCGAFGSVPIACKIRFRRTVLQSKCPTGFFARGFNSISTSSGTITVRAQYEILVR